MKERPIIFSTDMVLALLAGRKTQTRRIVKNPAKPPCEVGDVLWVKETFAHDGYGGYFYKAGDDGSLHDAIGAWKPSLFMPRDAARLLLEVKHVSTQALCKISDEDAVAEGVEREGRAFPFGLWSLNTEEATAERRRQMAGYYRDYLSSSTDFTERYPYASPIRSFLSLWEKSHGPISGVGNFQQVWVIRFKVRGAIA